MKDKAKLNLKDNKTSIPDQVFSIEKHLKTDKEDFYHSKIDLEN